MKLVIIGNGFDQHFRLPTGVEDFVKLIKDNDTENLYGCSGIYWNEYEESLSEIELDSMADSFLEVPDYLSDRESDRDRGIWGAEETMSRMLSIRNRALGMMIEEANSFIDKLDIEKKFNEDSLILSFNYTSTIESLFNMDTIVDIFHIHGYFKNKDELVFGYSKPNDDILSDFSQYDVITRNYSIDKDHEDSIIQAENNGSYDGIDYYIREQYQHYFDFYRKNQKELKTEKLINYIKPYTYCIDEVIVLGHSMGEVDAPYFEIIDDILTPKVWSISQYKGNPDSFFIREYTFRKKITFFSDIDDIISDI